MMIAISEANASVDASNKVRIGSNIIQSVGATVNWTAYSDERIKEDIKQDVSGGRFINRKYFYNNEVVSKMAQGIMNTLAY